MATVAQSMVGPGNYVSARTALPIAVPAQATTDFVIPIPTNAIDLNLTFFTTTAFGAVTDAQLSVGSTVGGVDYVAAVSVKAVQILAPTRVAAAAASFANPGGLILNVRITQSGGNSATGAGLLVATFGLPV